MNQSLFEENEKKEEEKPEIQDNETGENDNVRAMESDNEESCECNCASEDKSKKNLISIVILLAGLFVGSLFVDSAQLVRGNGYSAKNLNKSDIFEAQGKTWVAYGEPAVSVSVINDDSCGPNCDVSEALVWLRRVLPTISTSKVAYDSTEGKDLIAKYGIKTLPAFVFNSNITKSDFYSQAKVLFTENDSNFILNTQELGLPVGKYLESPVVGAGDATFGNPDSKVKVVIFSDFQCPYCKVFYSSLRGVMDQYKDRVFFDYKHLPLDFHAQAAGAALASECAQAQGKFWEYADKLYSSQDEWSKTKDTAKFKQYAATLGLKTLDFNKCLDDKKYQDRIDQAKSEAADFSIAGTPAIFINDQFSSGAITADDLKKNIEDQLSKVSQ